MRRIRILFLSVVVLIACHGQSEARRLRIPILIPGISNSEEIVKVLDLPDIPELRRDDGRHVDLGYLFKRSGGAWIGYIGSSKQYVPLTEPQLQMLLEVAGVSELPTVPTRRGRKAASGGGADKAASADEQGSLDGSAGGTFWIIVAAAGFFGWRMWTKWVARGPEQATTRMEEGGREGGLSGWAERAGKNLTASGLAEGASMGKARGPMPPKEPPPSAEGSRKPVPSARRGAITAGALAGHNARPAFGKR